MEQLQQSEYSWYVNNTKNGRERQFTFRSGSQWMHFNLNSSISVWFGWIHIQRILSIFTPKQVSFMFNPCSMFQSRFWPPWYHHLFNVVAGEATVILNTMWSCCTKTMPTYNLSSRKVFLITMCSSSYVRFCFSGSSTQDAAFWIVLRTTILQFWKDIWQNLNIWVNWTCLIIVTVILE